MAFLYGRAGRLTAKNSGFPARADITSIAPGSTSEGIIGPDNRTYFMAYPPSADQATDGAGVLKLAVEGGRFSVMMKAGALPTGRDYGAKAPSTSSLGLREYAVALSSFDVEAGTPIYFVVSGESAGTELTDGSVIAEMAGLTMVYETLPTVPDTSRSTDESVLAGITVDIPAGSIAYFAYEMTLDTPVRESFDQVPLTAKAVLESGALWGVDARHSQPVSPISPSSLTPALHQRDSWKLHPCLRAAPGRSQRRAHERRLQRDQRRGPARRRVRPRHLVLPRVVLGRRRPLHRDVLPAGAPRVAQGDTVVLAGNDSNDSKISM